MNYCPRTGKVQHASQHAAKHGAGKGENPRIYRCPHCSAWHVTHHRSELRPKHKWYRLAFGEGEKE